MLEFVFGLIGLIGIGLFELVRFFVGFRDVFVGEGINDLRVNFDGSLMVVFGLRVLKFLDDFGVDFGDGDKDFLE